MVVYQSVLLPVTKYFIFQNTCRKLDVLTILYGSISTQDVNKKIDSVINHCQSQDSECSNNSNNSIDLNDNKTTFGVFFAIHFKDSYRL